VLNISLDLGNIPSVLAALGDPRMAQKIANVAAECYNDDVHDWIDAGKGFTNRTGQLESNTNWHGNGDGSATVYANTDYAGFVEDGSGPHVIKPKDGRKGLRFGVSGGGYIIRRGVNHPGSKPHPFFFADISRREAHIQDKVLSVLAQAANHG